MQRVIALLFLFLLAVTVRAEPETVAITYRFDAANETALKKVIDGRWATLTKLDLVRGAHQLYRGNGFFLELFTWKDDSIPDAAPAEVRAWWKQMGELTVKGGLRIDAVVPVEARTQN